MRNKGIVSLVAVGLLASSLSVGTVKAEGNEFELAKKAIKGQVEKPLPKGLVDSATLNQLQVEIKGSAKSSTKGSNKVRMSSYDDGDYTGETEYNNDFDSANMISFDELTVGQLLPLYDIDVYEVVVPTNGLLLVGGIANSYNINLEFSVKQKDFVENSKLEYLGNEYNEDGVEVKAYQAKAGTYYIGVYDQDNEYDNDNNTEEDLYGIRTEFVDNVEPSKPSVNKVDDNDKVVKGKAESSSTVTVKVGSKTLGSAKTNSNGNYSVEIKAQKKGTTLSVTANDEAGNVSPKAPIKVVKH